MTRRKRKKVHVAVATRHDKVYILGVDSDRDAVVELCKRWTKKFPRTGTVAVDTFYLGFDQFEEAAMLAEE